MQLRGIRMFNWGELPGFLKGIILTAPPAAGVFAVITSAEPAMNAWDKGGLPTMATRAWVRDGTEPLKTQIVDIQLDIARGKRDQNMIARNKLEIDAVAVTDAKTRVATDQEIRRLNETISELNNQIRSVSGGRGPQ